MNLIGERIEILTSSDPTKVGRSGRVLMDTAKTLVVGSTRSAMRVEKQGAEFLLLDSGKVVKGLDIAGRPEDRLGRRAQ